MIKKTTVARKVRELSHDSLFVQDFVLKIFFENGPTYQSILLNSIYLILIVRNFVKRLLLIPFISCVEIFTDSLQDCGQPSYINLAVYKIFHSMQLFVIVFCNVPSQLGMCFFVLLHAAPIISNKTMRVFIIDSFLAEVLFLKGQHLLQIIIYSRLVFVAKILQSYSRSILIVHLWFDLGFDKVNILFV